MNVSQILHMLNAPIYNTLPVTDDNVTFIDIVNALISLIDGARLKSYMVLTLENGLNDDDGKDVDNPELENIMIVPFDAQCEIWQNHFHVILDQATEDQCFIMLNILNTLNLDPVQNIDNNIFQPNNNIIQPNNNIVPQIQQ